MTASRPKRLIGVGLAALLVAAMTGIAGADEFESDASNPESPPPATSTINVWLVAVQENNSWDKNNPCNVGSSSDSHAVTASVTGAGAAVASVTPATLTFETCGVAQTITITFAAQGTCNKTGTVTIALQSVSPNSNAVKGSFNTETINVSVGGSAPTDPSCTGGGGGGGNVLCSEPAAPAWAAQILKLNGVKPRQTDNLISKVAQAMTVGAVFDNVSKATHPEYEDAVYSFLQGAQSGLTKGPGDVKLAKPAWDCVTV